MLNYFNSARESTQIFKHALSFMSEHAINPTPINYVVVYEYCMQLSNSDKDAKKLRFLKEIEETIASHDGFNDVAGLRLYKKFIESVPESAQDIIDRTQDLPDMLTKFIDKAHNYVVYHVGCLENPNLKEQRESLSEVKTIVADLEEEVSNIKAMHKRINTLVHHGGKGSYKDVFTGLYADKKAAEQYELMKKSSQNQVHVAYFTFEGMSDIVKDFGKQVEEAIARHFVRTVTPELPSNVDMYRWQEDDGYIILSYNPKQLEIYASLIKDAFNKKVLKHKFTKQNITERLTLKHAVVSAGKNLTLLVRSAKQRLK